MLKTKHMLKTKRLFTSVNQFLRGSAKQQGDRK